VKSMYTALQIAQCLVDQTFNAMHVTNGTSLEMPEGWCVTVVVVSRRATLEELAADGYFGEPVTPYLITAARRRYVHTTVPAVRRRNRYNTMA
jgi:hypothetical protein